MSNLAQGGHPIYFAVFPRASNTSVQELSREFLNSAQKVNPIERRSAEVRGPLDLVEQRVGWGTFYHAKHTFNFDANHLRENCWEFVIMDAREGGREGLSSSNWKTPVPRPPRRCSAPARPPAAAHKYTSTPNFPQSSRGTFLDSDQSPPGPATREQQLGTAPS